MKKRLISLSLALVLLAAVLFSGCGSSAKAAYSSPAAAAETAYEPIPEPMAAPSAYLNGFAADEDFAVSEEMDMEAGGVAVSGTGAGTGAQASPAGQMSADKIIYSADAQIETIEYDKTIQCIYDLVEQVGGFVESSGISGSNYYNSARGQKTYRTAGFTLRIPSREFKNVTSSLSSLGNVPYCNTYSENVTSQYYDVQSRITSYKTQETRLLEMLEIAESVEDLLAIQSQLAEVQYQIDYYQSRLTNYDRQINYSTLNLTVSEVAEYTAPPEPVEKTYWQKMGDGFKESLENVGDFFCDLFLWVISNLPALIAWVVFLWIVFILGRKAVRKRKSRPDDGLTGKERRLKKKAERKAAKASTAEASVEGSNTEE